MWHSLSIGGSYTVQWRKNLKNLKTSNVFLSFIVCENRNRSALAVNCWVIIHCLLVSCTKINHSRYMLVIWSSLQLTSKQWIITQQFTARADLFLKYTISIITLVWINTCRQGSNCDIVTMSSLSPFILRKHLYRIPSPGVKATNVDPQVKGINHFFTKRIWHVA